MKILTLALLGLAAYAGQSTAPQNPAPPSVDAILSAYARAVGGQAAVDGITTREVRGSMRRGPKVTYIWQKPNKVFLDTGKEKVGYDGGSGWQVSRKKKLKRLALGAQIPLEIDANPLRYVYLKSLYSDISSGSPETLDGKPMDVLIAPNTLGATKFYFDAQSHLLHRIEETGDVSAYYKNTAELDDYQRVGAVLFPFRIRHSTTAPGGATKEFRVSKVNHNVPVRPELFTKSQAGAVIFGGKR